jgi:REP element-mobilizing transposase RayT
VGAASRPRTNFRSLIAENDESSVWQPGYHDHAVRQDEDLRAMARYVVANPVRAGLVKDIGDYPHWDAVWL